MQDKRRLPPGVTGSGLQKQHKDSEPVGPDRLDPNSSKREQFIPTGVKHQSHKDTHEVSDVDSGHSSLHHTLGRGANQAAPGNIVQSVYLIGEVKMWLADTPPKGYLFLDGSTYLRSDYPLLFRFAEDAGQIGKSFGAGNGSTTFTVPDMRQRLPVGNVAPSGTSLLGEHDNYSLLLRQQKFTIEHAHDVFVTEEEAVAGEATTSVDMHSHVMSYEDDHTHTVANTDLTQVSNTSVDGSNNRLTGPATHSHGLSADGRHAHFNDLHSHNHTLDVAVPAHAHDFSFTGQPRDFFSEGNEPGNERDLTPPHMYLNFIMCYTNLLDFEGSDFNVS